MTVRLDPDRLPDQDVIGILLHQHRRIRDLIAEVRTAGGRRKSEAFDELRALLAAHETAEELVLRPLTRTTAGAEVAEAVNAEEALANGALADLERMDVHTTDFDEAFARFGEAVEAHARHEEREEFPVVLRQCSPEQLENIGRTLLAAERMAPTHAHPTAAGSTVAQWAFGPFASMTDRARDALSSVARES